LQPISTEVGHSRQFSLEVEAAQNDPPQDPPLSALVGRRPRGLDNCNGSGQGGGTFFGEPEMTYQAAYLLLMSEMQEWVKDLEDLDEAIEEGDVWRSRYRALLVKTRMEIALARSVEEARS
jgi:hypothetical protein